jgi:hypothetical protein
MSESLKETLLLERRAPFNLNIGGKVVGGSASGGGREGERQEGGRKMMMRKVGENGKEENWGKHLNQGVFGGEVGYW